MNTTLDEIDIRISALFTAFVSAYLVPAWGYILLCIFLVLADSFLGVLSIPKRGDKFSMRRLIFKGIILKFAVYFPVIVGAVKINELLFEPIFGTNIPLLISLIFIFTYDLRSIWKHFRLLRGGGGVEDMKAMNDVFTWLRKVIDKIHDKDE